MTEQINDRIADLEAQLAALKAEVRTGSPDANADEQVDRRGLLRKAGMAVAGVAAGGYVLAQASPAGAADGQNIVIGQNNVGSSATVLNTDAAPRVIFLANSSSFTPGDSSVETALAGWGDSGRYGVYAWAADKPGFFAASSGPDVASAQLIARSAPPASGAHSVGELQMLTNGRLVVCSVAGTPGTWSSVGITPVTPTRFLDTRNNIGLNGKQGEGDGNVRTLTIAGTTVGSTTIPSSARAIAANITVTNPTSGGFVTVWNTGVARPDASNVNFTPGLTVANFAILPLGDGGAINLYNAFGQTDLLLDISGYFL